MSAVLAMDRGTDARCSQASAPSQSAAFSELRESTHELGHTHTHTNASSRAWALGVEKLHDVTVTQSAWR